MTGPNLLRAARLRYVERPFGWAPFRLVTSGLLARLSVQAKALYLALCLVADHRGLSYWGDHKLAALVGVHPAELDRARTELVRHDLLDFDGRTYQLLSLPRPDARSSTPQNSPPPDPRAGEPRSSPTRRERRGDPEPIAAIIGPLLARLEPTGPSNGPPLPRTTEEETP